MESRFMTLKEFKEGLKRFSAENYTNPPTNHSPMGYLVAQSFFDAPRFNCARYWQYAKLLLKDAAAKGCDTSALKQQIDQYFEERIRDPQNPNFILNFINEVAQDESTADKVSVLPLVCGAGKSTAISYLIRQVIEQNDDNGILIVTDSKERMAEYTNPSYFISQFLKKYGMTPIQYRNRKTS